MAQAPHEIIGIKDKEPAGAKVVKRGWKDRIKPGRVSIDKDHIIVGRYCTRVLEIREFPPSLMTGFLDELLGLQRRVSVSLRIRPKDRGACSVLLKRKITQLRAELIAKERRGDIDTYDIELKLQDAEGLIDRLTAREINMFDFALHIIVQGRDLKELEATTEEVITTLRGLGFKVKYGKYVQEDAFRTILPGNYGLLGDERVMDSSALQAFFPFVSGHIMDPDGILYGFNAVNASPVIVDRFKGESYHSAVIGVIGSGKSYMTKLEMLRYRIRYPDTVMFVIDPLGEYGPAVYALGGSVIRFGAESKNNLNPMKIYATNKDYETAVAEKVDTLIRFISLLIGGMDAGQRALLDSALMDLYNSQPGREITLRDLVEYLKTLTESEVKATARALVSYLSPYATGTQRWLSERTNVDIRGNLICFDLSSLPETLKTPMMFIMLTYIWDRCREDETTRTLIYVDEAHNLFFDTLAAEYVEIIARHGRHYHTGLTLITQTPDSFLGNKHARTVLELVRLKIIFYQERINQQSVEFFKFTPAEKRFIETAKRGKIAGYSQAMFIAGDVRVPIEVLASKMEHKLITTDPKDLARPEIKEFRKCFGE